MKPDNRSLKDVVFSGSLLFLLLIEDAVECIRGQVVKILPRRR
jgi:hypothetical protein